MKVKTNGSFTGFYYKLHVLDAFENFTFQVNSPFKESLLLNGIIVKTRKLTEMNGVNYLDKPNQELH